MPINDFNNGLIIGLALKGGVGFKDDSLDSYTIPIRSQKSWRAGLITSKVGTRSSICLRRPEGLAQADMVFVAQVEDGIAIIKKADPRFFIKQMEWTTVATIPNVSELSIMFDGYMVMRDNIVEAYTTGDLPIVFYVDSSNSLKGWNMNNDAEFTISDTAYNVASVRGLYSEAAGLDDGIWVFYTNSLGELWEARVLNDEVAELTEITLKPSGVTGWEDVWATLTFDYRVALQLKGDDGNVHTLMSYSRTGGFSNIEYFGAKGAKVDSGQCGIIPPNFVGAAVTEITSNPSKTVRIVFDGPVYNVSNADRPNIKLYSAYSETFQEEYQPTSITAGESANEALLSFGGISRVLYPVKLVGTNLTMGSQNLGTPNFVFEFDPLAFALLPGNYEWVSASSAVVDSGAMEKAFDGKAYAFENCAAVSGYSINGGALNVLVFNKGYLIENCSAIVSYTVNGGVMCDINNVPL